MDKVFMLKLYDEVHTVNNIRFLLSIFFEIFCGKMSNWVISFIIFLSYSKDKWQDVHALPNFGSHLSTSLVDSIILHPNLIKCRTDDDNIPKSNVIEACIFQNKCCTFNALRKPTVELFSRLSY